MLFRYFCCFQILCLSVFIAVHGLRSCSVSIAICVIVRLSASAIPLLVLLALFFLDVGCTFIGYVYKRPPSPIVNGHSTYSSTQE
jgi:hypothetical protein